MFISPQTSAREGSTEDGEREGGERNSSDSERERESEARDSGAPSTIRKAGLVHHVTWGCRTLVG